jgi:hypothetical protein
MARLLAFIIFGLAIAAGANELIAARDLGKDVHFLPIGQYWFQIHQDSLTKLQPALENSGFGMVWDPLMLWILLQPAVPALAIFAIVLWLIGGRRRRAARPARRSRTNNKSPEQREAPARRTGEGTPHAGPHRPAHSAQSGPVRRMR